MVHLDSEHSLDRYGGSPHPTLVATRLIPRVLWPTLRFHRLTQTWRLFQGLALADQFPHLRSVPSLWLAVQTHASIAQPSAPVVDRPDVAVFCGKNRKAVAPRVARRFQPPRRFAAFAATSPRAVPVAPRVSLRSIRVHRFGADQVIFPLRCCAPSSCSASSSCFLSNSCASFRSCRTSSLN